MKKCNMESKTQMSIVERKIKKIIKQLIKWLFK